MISSVRTRRMDWPVGHLGDWIRAWLLRGKVLVVALALGTLAACGGGGVDTPAPAQEPPAAVTVQPVSQSAAAGSAVTFSVVAIGNAVSFQWQRSTDAAASWADIPGASAASYTLDVVESTMAGHQFRAVVRAGGASVTSAAAALTVTPPAAPVITTQPVDQSAPAGAAATFAVAANGFALRYQWQVSTDAGVTWSNAANGTTATLTLPAVSLADSGRRLRVTVSNDGGSVASQSATLTVAPSPAAPSITQQPQDAAALVGATATFAVAATGNPTPGFQWQRSVDAGTTFAAIPGATGSSYTTLPLTAADNATRYRVVASSAQGSVASRIAVLTVTTPPSGTLPQVALSVAFTSCATRSDSVLTCWGSNDGGMVNGEQFGTWFARPTPVPGVTDAVDVSVGIRHVCAVRADGTVICWGSNPQGQLGLGPDRVSSFFVTPPTLVPGLSAVTQVVTGLDFTCARRTDGSVTCWGSNLSGQLGDGTTTRRASPNTVPGLAGVMSLAASPTSACALRSNGTVACWGFNGNGRLGDGTSTDRLTPVTVAGLRDIIAIRASGSAGNAGHLCALRSDGVVLCWGKGDAGQTGSDVDLLTPRAVPGIADAIGLAVSNAHSCALRATGTVLCWGSNGNGSLGAGPGFGATSSTVPVAVVGLNGVVALAAGAWSTCAARADGSVYCWGYNGNGQLGDGTLGSRSVPTRIPGFSIQLR